MDWSHTLSYSNRISGGVATPHGWNWFCQGVPQLGKDGSGNIAVIGIINDAIWFNKSGSNYVARFFSLEKLAEQGTGANDEFVFTDTQGRVTKYFGFDAAIPAAKQGQFKSYTDAFGTSYAATYNGSNQITQVSLGGSPALSYNYDYYTSGTGSGCIQYVTLKRSTTNVRRLYLVYYAAGDANGGDKDLQSVTLQSWNGTSWDDLQTWYFRYATANGGGGIVHGLKLVVSPEGYTRATAGGSDINSLSDSSLQGAYADSAFQFDASKRVTQEVVNGQGLGSSSSTTATYGYAYSTSGNADGYNNWKNKNVETLPNGNSQTAYGNYAGQVMLKTLTQSATSNKWYEYYKYDASGRVIQRATSEAVSSVSEASPGLVTLNASAGLIRVYEYYSSTDLPNGAVTGYLRYEKVQQGSGGTPVLLKEYKYTSQTAGSVTTYPLWKSIVYQDSSGGGSSPAETVFSYTFFSGTVQVQQKTTAWPAVSTGQNGSGTSNQKIEVFDQYGQLIWVKDELGFLTRLKYDNASGGLIQRIDDVATGQISDSPAVPSGWTTPSGGGLHLVTDYTVDSLGRTKQELSPLHSVPLSGTATNLQRATWTVYNESSTANEVRWAQGYVATSSSTTSTVLIEPITVTTRDRNGRTTDVVQSKRAAGVTGALTASEDLSDQTKWVRWRHSTYLNLNGKANSQRVYYDIQNGDYNETLYGYDGASSEMGWRTRKQSPGGTITRWVYNSRGLVAEKWIGTDDTGATDSSPGGASPNNMVKVESYDYDGGAAAKNGNLTTLTQYVDSNASNNRTTTYIYDWRNRRTSQSGELSSYEAYTYDNLDRITQVDQKNGSGGNLIGRQQTSYDNLGRIYQQLTYAVDPATGTVGNSLATNSWYDARGLLMKQKSPGSSMLLKLGYDGVARPTRRYLTYNTSDTTYTTAGSITGDTILQQDEYGYDAARNLNQTTTRQRFHNATGTGVLDGTSTEPRSRVSYLCFWPDALGREQGRANYGTNGASSFSRPTTIPTRSDTALVSTTAFNTRGEAYQVTDPKAVITQYTFDDSGRITKQVDDHGASKLNRETQYIYNTDDRLVTLTAKNAVTGDQITRYCYGTTLSDSDLASNDLLRSTIFPDSADTDPSGTDQVKLAYNRQGEIKLQTDQAGTVHALEYDKLGRFNHDRVTTFGTNVDQTVKRITRSYEARGLLQKLTSYDNATVGSGSVVNDVQYTYNTFSQLTIEYQSHSGTVNTGTTPKVQYAYANGSANHIRSTSITYPNGQVNTYDYGSGADDFFSRVTSILQSTIHLVDYLYLGVAEIVQSTYSSQPGVALTYLMQAGDTTGDAGDQYIGLDRFGRVVDQRWIKTSTLTNLARIQYGFDRNSNRTFRNDLVAGTGQDEFYVCDNLAQLKSLDRGTLNGSRTGITGTPTWEEDFNFDETGNWHGATSGYRTKTNGVTGLDQNRTNNTINAITGISTATGTAWSVPAYNAVGNMTSIPQPAALNSAYTGVYDAWSRLVQLKSGATTVATYRYDGADRRVTKLISADTRHYYYSDSWQILEERINTLTTADRQFVWGLRYEDDLVLRDRGSERFYVLHDYFHPVAVIDTSAIAQERYGFNAYGATNVMTPAFGARASSNFEWETRFAACRWDTESGLYQVRHRYLNPLAGVWISIDPLFYGDDGMNLYSYARNSPTTLIDPLGLACPPGYTSQGTSWTTVSNTTTNADLPYTRTTSEVRRYPSMGLGDSGCEERICAQPFVCTVSITVLVEAEYETCSKVTYSGSDCNPVPNVEILRTPTGRGRRRTSPGRPTNCRPTGPKTCGGWTACGGIMV